MTMFSRACRVKYLPFVAPIISFKITHATGLVTIRYIVRSAYVKYYVKNPVCKDYGYGHASLDNVYSTPFDTIRNPGLCCFEC